MRIVLPLSRYLLYRFGMNAPSRPNSSMKTHVPAPKASMLTAPLAHDPDEAAKIFLCQVGTKKFLRFYKPFIGGRPPVNGL